MVNMVNMASDVLATEISANDEGEEVVVDCVAFFYEEGKSGENIREKNKFRCKVKKAEKSLQNLKKCVW